MMTPAFRVGLLALVGLALVVCQSRGPNPNNNGDNGGDNGFHPSRPVLRANIGIDLAQVSSFVTISGGNQARSLRARQWAAGGENAGAGDAGTDDAGVPDGGNTGPQLLALTVSGETLDVSLVEEGNPRAVGVVAQPQVMGIYPTAAWVLFSTPNLSVYRIHDDGSTEFIACSLIAARRLGGALYCAPLWIGFAGDNRFATVQSNAAGDVAYALAAVYDSQGDPQAHPPDNSSYYLYKITLDGTDGPSAAAATDSQLHTVNWFLTNAEGDLMVNYYPSPLDQTTTQTKVWGADGSTAFTVQGAHDSFAICGVATADENAFYVVSGGGGGWPFQGTILVVTKSGSSFVETPQQTQSIASGGLADIYRLSDGFYMYSKLDMALFRVIVDGVVDPNPPSVALTGIDSIIELGGSALHPASGKVVFLATTSTGYKFVRHDGVTQVDISLDPNIELTNVNFSTTGGIDFIGYRIDTQEKIRGSVAADSTDVIITSAGVLGSAQTVVFTRIN